MAVGIITTALFLIAGLAAPSAAPAPAPASASIPNYRGAVPVVVYHGLHDTVNASTDPYSIPRAEFARQMAMLSANGFHTISIAQYARFAFGDLNALPDRPILITFDDGRIDSFQGADQVLARYGMRATMFVITANAAPPKPGYLSWAQLVAMSATGRWDLQEHAHAGHVNIPTGPGRQVGPYYANLLYRNGSRETFTQFKRRVTSDILTGRRLMASKVSGFEPLAFALPYGSYGQVRTNYAPIPGWESGWLERTFSVLFVQDRHVYNLPGNPIGQRYGIHASTTAATLQRWLAQALPKSALVAPAPPAARPPVPKRPRRPSLRRLRVRKRVVLMTFRLPDHTTLSLTRRRAGHRRTVRIAVIATNRVRDRRLRPGTVYIYRAVAVDAAGRHSRTLRLRLRTHRR